MSIFQCFNVLFLDFGVPVEYTPVCGAIFTSLFVFTFIYLLGCIFYEMKVYLVFKTEKHFFVRETGFLYFISLPYYIKRYNRFNTKLGGDCVIQVIKIPDRSYVSLIANNDNISYYKDCKVVYDKQDI